MSDIAPVVPPSPWTSAPTPDAGALPRPADTPAADEPAPVETVPTPVRTREALQRQIDRVLENADTSLRFRVDDELGRIVVSVIDGRGDVVMQVPDETALAIARRLARDGQLLDLKA
jgi:flagellar protein FlaG